MKKLIVMLAAAACVTQSPAMPTNSEIASAQTLVAELMADDLAAFKAKSKKADEIGDLSVQYAKEAETEAAKFVLLKGAVSYYVQGGAYDKAADAVDELRASVADVPPAVVESIIRKDAARLTAKKAPRLFAQQKMLKVQMAAVKEIAATKSALAKSPNDAALMRKLAEAQAISGDWKTALGTFALINDKVGATAKDEAEGKNLPAVADFWWTYESYRGANDADAFKSHAAEIYRACLTDGSIGGLKKNIVEKRLKQMEVVSAASTAVMSKNSIDNFSIDIGNGEKIEFIACPAGTFTMGYEDRPGGYQKHTVKISRPFWISKYLVSIAQWQALMGKDDDVLESIKKRSGEDTFCPGNILGGNKTPAISSYDDYLEFMRRLTKINKRKLPHGYVFRYPTEAEWEYACKAGGKETGAYGKISWTDEEYSQVSMTGKSRRDLLHKKGIKERCLNKIFTWRPWEIPALPIDYGTPNQWGIYGLIGNGQFTLDSVDLPQKPFPENMIVDIKYPMDVSVDPLSVFTKKDQHNIACGDPWLGIRRYRDVTASEPLTKMNQYAGGVHPEVKLRIAIGPDLLKEKKIKRVK